jgi:hypothetical protein
MADNIGGPALSRMQIGPGEGPEMWVPWRVGELLSLHGRFMFRHYDLCRFHQLIHAEITERAQASDTSWARLTDLPHPEDEWEELRQARMREAIRAQDLESEGVRSFAQQTFVVALWALAEQFCGRTLVTVERLSGADEGPPPYRWADLKTRYERIGIALAGGKSYDGAQECRTLNNKIKHLGAVDGRLATYGHFRGTEGKQLEEVAINAQYYADAVFEFVGWCMEMGDERLSAPG